MILEKNSLRREGVLEREKAGVILISIFPQQFYTFLNWKKKDGLESFFFYIYISIKRKLRKNALKTIVCK